MRPAPAALPCVGGCALGSCAFDSCRLIRKDSGPSAVSHSELTNEGFDSPSGGTVSQPAVRFRQTFLCSVMQLFYYVTACPLIISG